MDTRIICVIPARYGSTRLPGKPLCEINGIPLVMWVYNRAIESAVFNDVYIATDDKRIFETVQKFDGQVIMTSTDHPRGTDRIFEVVQKISCTHVVNLQGDEPLIPDTVLIDFVENLKKVNDYTLLTIASHATIEERDNPHIVKVVMNHFGEALYFSRSAIPFHVQGGDSYFKHKGIYGFTSFGLNRFCSFPQGDLEQRESLEQLRALEYGMKVRCLLHDFESIGIDTPEDLQKFRSLVAKDMYGNRK